MKRAHSWEQMNVTNGPYGLIRVEDIYFNSNGIFNLDGEKISTKKAKEIIKLKEPIGHTRNTRN